MSSHDTLFADARILVVEDEYFLASDLAEAIGGTGAKVVGPSGRLADARELAKNEKLNIAVLDVNLRGEMVFDLLDELLDRQVPVLLATGYSRSALPDRYRSCHFVEKPYKIPDLLSEIARHLQGAAPA
ncbi:response regulator [Sphingobium sp. SCG-1]|uniref:response regulator n=1 Tax=Sphingobium sp. SCG-1 TaxID=2072936 RepID=UPI00166FF9C8|nr:response regulator [Sphingobium sp. SCG-1]